MREYTLEELEEWESAYFDGGVELTEGLVEFLFRVAKERAQKK